MRVTVVVSPLTGADRLLFALACGFWARVLTGPTLGPLAGMAMNVVAARLGEPRPVLGPPKRFAQGTGAVRSTTAFVLRGARSSCVRRALPSSYGLLGEL